MIRDELPPICVDIDKDRIREIVTEALRMMHEYLEEETFGRPDNLILDQLNAVINSNKVTTYFFLSIGSRSMPDLTLRVDPVRKEVLCKSGFKKKVAKLNHFIKAL